MKQESAVELTLFKGSHLPQRLSRMITSFYIGVVTMRCLSMVAKDPGSIRPPPHNMVGD